MNERPILFSAPMVRATLEGRKTQTRRIMKPTIVQHIEFMGGSDEESTEFDFIGLRYDKWKSESGKEMPAEWLIYCTEYPKEGVIPIGQLYGAVGDRLWVRETHLPKASGTIYRADFSEAEAAGLGGMYGGWKPSIFCKREHSRILLEITGVRAERLQDISEDDALAEGINKIAHGREGYFYHYKRTESHQNNKCYANDAFQELWESINGPGSWDVNPWVWVIEFKAIKP